MKQEYINPIFEATKSVLQNMIQVEVERGELEVRKSPFAAQKVNASIGVTGDLKGFIYYSMADTTALEVFAKMAGMSADKFDELVSSAIGELANIVTGNSLTNLSELGYQCDITPPSITYGDNVQITTNQRKFLVIPLKTDIGDFEINVSLEENKK
ncbi:chemotaxis protein CheX [Orenia marismortui]|uniref:Chemotaxis protein CheX n=1 Tax=Orenia marismortui TaxID=46469 RepID=A0A4V3GY84_9FIRM|nr:chemotaxis protein CheX [Orenia marismortui]TDX51179.1 chemotaxis protein CheX [Orenia marismortui]